MNTNTDGNAATDKDGGINILIVDDETEFLHSIGKRLTARGFHVFLKSSGEKAIACARDNSIDIALVDLKMPGIDGEVTLKCLKNEHKWMEIVILTGHGSAAAAMSCLDSGAYSYLEKPCELNKLLIVLGRAYKKRIMNEAGAGQNADGEKNRAIHKT